MTGFKKPTLKDIAKETQLSISTVSRIINGKSDEYRISRRSHDFVIDAARKLNYYANDSAADLKLTETRTIALLIPSLRDSFFANIAGVISQDLREEGFLTILCESDEDLNTEKKILENLFKINVEGLIIVPCSNSYEHILLLKESGLPIVCVDRYFEELDLAYVSTNNYIGSYQATSYLIESGHSNIVAIQGLIQAITNKQRVNGFVDAIHEYGIDDYKIIGKDYKIQNAYLETKLILKDIRPSAIFALSNTIVMGCIKAISEENLIIPEDISLIAFDDDSYLDYLSTPITSVVQPVSDIAKLATRILFSIFNNEETNTQKALLKPIFKQRSSVRILN